MADEDSKNLTCEIQDGAPVIPIGGYNAAQPARLVAELRSYWDGLRQGRAVPMRTDVQPAGIGRGLDFAFILERIAPGAARFRLAGRLRGRASCCCHRRNHRAIANHQAAFHWQ